MFHSILSLFDGYAAAHENSARFGSAEREKTTRILKLE
jgi:hypothetical protein